MPCLFLTTHCVDKTSYTLQYSISLLQNLVFNCVSLNSNTTLNCHHARVLHSQLFGLISCELNCLNSDSVLQETQQAGVLQG